MDKVEAQVRERPLWRRIVDFPLVAMLIGTVLMILVRMLAPFLIATYIGFTGAHVAPEHLAALINGPYLVPVAIITILASIAVYKLVIRHLGRQPRDDLAWTGKSGKQLG